MAMFAAAKMFHLNRNDIKGMTNKIVSDNWEDVKVAITKQEKEVERRRGRRTTTNNNNNQQCPPPYHPLVG